MSLRPAAAGPQAPDLAQARRLLGGEPARAVALARQALAAAPHSLEAALLLGAALRRAGDPAAAIARLTPLAQAAPRAWGVHFELGGAFAALGRTAPAIGALTRAVELNPAASLAWHALGDQLALADDTRGAQAAQARPLPGSVADPALRQGLAALADGDLAAADSVLERRFGLHPTDPLAVRLLAHAAALIGRNDAAEGLLRPLLESAPDFMPARSAWAVILLTRNEPQAALVELERLASQAPDSSLVLSLRGAARVQVGDYAPALDDFRRALAAEPDEPRIWISYGHALRTVGDQAAAVEAYRRSLALAPGSGEAWWSLANLKVVRFSPEDLAAMEGALEALDLSEEDRTNLHFALGKALEDAGRVAPAFGHYARGNALRRAAWPYDAEANRAYVRRTIELFTPEFLEARAGWGSPAEDPIFVVGLPRSGSTLIEQILASHPQVEGVSELPELMAVAAGLSAAADPAGVARREETPGLHYPAMLADLPPEALARAGEDYLARAAVHRRTARPFFVDKLPNNFLQLGLILLILPHARIIDARREPMACGFSIFKQNFARGAQFSYDLADLGRYYRDYLDLMAHFDAVAPGRVFRVQHEDLVAAPEPVVRALLDHCGLAFDPACLRFWETQRPVRTASSEQVRRPLSTAGLDAWRPFAPHLAPLAAALAE